MSDFMCYDVCLIVDEDKCIKMGDILMSKLERACCEELNKHIKQHENFVTIPKAKITYNHD